MIASIMVFVYYVRLKCCIGIGLVLGHGTIHNLFYLFCRSLTAGTSVASVPRTSGTLCGVWERT